MRHCRARSGWPAARVPPRARRRRRVVVLPLVVAAGSFHAALPPAAATADGQPPAAAARTAQHLERPGHVRGRMLVGFDTPTTPDARRAALATVGARPLARFGQTTVAALDPAADVERAAGRLAGDPAVAFAEPDYLRVQHACPDCWHLDAGDAPRPGVGARALHEQGITGEGAVVAVLDTGVSDVPDLAGRVIGRRACAVSCGPARTPSSPHGTMVASLIVARDDRAGITGVAPAARIRAWQVDTGDGIPTSAVVAALQEVIASPDVTVVNMSFGGTAYSAAERAAVERTLAAGKVVVASSGNDGSYVPQYPAAYQGVLSVGATGGQGAVADFTSYGKLDVLAPGTCLPAASPGGMPPPPGCPEAARAGVGYVTGTSFSAPLVSGVLALRLAATPRRTRLGLLGTARAEPPGGLDDVKRWGHGLVDARAWVASFAEDADPYLVVEATRQLPYPAAAEPTRWRAAVLTSGGTLEDPPDTAEFSGLTGGTAPFREAEPGVHVAELPSGRLDPGAGTAVEAASAATAAGTIRAGASVRVLRLDDQAPGVPLRGDGPWRPVDGVQGGGSGPTLTDDSDDVFAVRLAVGQRLDAVLRSPSGTSIGLALFAPGTTDVFGQIDRVVAGGTAPDAQGRSRLRHVARRAGVYLLDVYAQGLESGAPARGRYTLDVALR